MKKHSAGNVFKLNENALKTLAGAVYFERGVTYYRSGAVSELVSGRDHITARLQGSTDVPYLVRFWLDHGELQWGCACPLGVDGAFCKHLVAAGLAWINDNDDALHMEPDLEAVIANLRTALAPFNREQLLDMLVQRAIWDESFLEELHLLTRSIKNN